MIIRHLLFLVLISSGGNLVAQEVSIIRQSDKLPDRQKKKAVFHFIEDGIDTTTLQYVATLSVSTAASPSLEKIYDEVKARAQKMGANAMKLQQFDQQRVAALVDLYLLTEDQVNRNNAAKPLNTLHVFAGEPYEKSDYFAFEFNGTVKTLRNGTYFRHAFKEGEQVKLRKGMVTGTIMWVKWKPAQLPNYYSIHGFSDEPVLKRTEVSNSQKPGKFHPVESALGAFLTAVLEEKKD